MRGIYSVNPNLDIPIYQQLADSICTAIKNNKLSAGEQLPTVQQMTDELGVARGTVKRAYDELESRGYVEKVQGRGTFVCYRSLNSGNRKENAMAAIDTMLKSLEEMGFSPEEISIFLNLKLREYMEEESHVKVALVECNPENLSQMSEQMRHIDGVDLYSYTFDSIKEYPYKLSDDFDYIVTTQSHAEYLENIVPNSKRVMHIALRLPAQCLSHIIKLRRGKKVGILGYSERFTELLYDTCKTYAENIELFAPLRATSAEEVKKYFKGKDTILVPKGYEKYFGEEVSKLVHSFKGEVIDCYYEMDEGSLLYIEAKVKRLLEEKTI